MPPESKHRLDRSSPVVIGCNGGSGSRVLAEIVQELGIYMGLHDSRTLDNIWFPSFFFDGITYFFDDLAPIQSRIIEALELFAELTFSPFTSTAAVVKARTKWFGYMLKMQGHHSNYVFRSPRFQKIYQLQTKQTVPEAMFSHWGWKEPISHFYLQHLNQYFPGMKYIHLIRNGLDMAYTENQMHYWLLAKFYKVQIPRDAALRPKAYLNMWAQTNLQTIAECNEFLRNRFIIVRFEDLCLHPVEQINRLADFLALDCAADMLKKLARLVKRPDTIGRHKYNDLSIFSQNDLRLLQELGY